MPSVVVDTSVLMDMLVESRPRHAKAEVLRGRLNATRMTVRVPMYALFEIAAAIKQEMAHPTGGQFHFNTALTAKQPLDLEFVTVDQAFSQKYYSEHLPQLRAGDLVFVAMARADGVPLITADNKQHAKAASAL